MIMLKCLSNMDTYQHVHYNSMEPSWLFQGKSHIKYKAYIVKSEFKYTLQVYVSLKVYL